MCDKPARVNDVLLKLKDVSLYLKKEKKNYIVPVVQEISKIILALVSYLLHLEMEIKTVCATIVFCLFSSFYYVSCGGETLVLLDNLALRETHSMFFKGLQGDIY